MNEQSDYIITSHFRFFIVTNFFTLHLNILVYSVFQTKLFSFQNNAFVFGAAGGGSPNITNKLICIDANANPRRLGP